MPVTVNQNGAMYLRFCFCLVLVVSLFMLPVQDVLSKSYTIPIIKVEVIVQPDGSVAVTEHRTYRFDGSYTWADYRLPFRGFSTIKDLRVLENEDPYRNENNEEPGTFQVQRNEDTIRLQWFYEAQDEERTFTISYTLEGSLTVGPEWSQFFWSYLSGNREKDTDSLSVALQLPAAVGADSIHTWSRGPQQKIFVAGTSNGYTAEAVNIDNSEPVTIRSVFPSSTLYTPEVQITDSTFSLDWAQADEQVFRQKQAEQAERDEQYAEYGWQLMLLTILISIGGFAFFYQKFGKRYSARSVSVTETIMIPGRLKPAVTGWLISRHIGSHQLLATLLDLARRGYFIIEEQEPENKIFGAKKQVFSVKRTASTPADELTDWEKSVADFVNRQIAESNNRLDELFSGSSMKSAKWFSEWKEMLKTYCKKKALYDSKSYTGVYANIIIQILLLVPAILATSWAGPAGLAAIIVVALMLIASFAIVRRTKEGEVQYAKWKAYKKGLRNAADHSVSDDLLDKHFIYAIALGLSKEAIENLFRQMDTQQFAFIWFVLHNTPSTQSYAATAGTFSTLAATGASSFPGSSSSAAAGASAGAAGGGASGGAG